MRIVQIIDSLEAGGAERMAVNYANALVDECSFSGLVSSRSEGSLKEILDNKVQYLFLRKGKTIDIGAVMRLRRYCTDNKVDFIHAHSSSYFLALLVKLTYPQLQIIWHDHNGMGDLRGSAEAAMLRFSTCFFKGIIVVNNRLKRWALSALHCKEVVYLPNFTNREEVKEGLTMLYGKSGKRILCLANLREAKNHAMLIKVSLRLRESHPEWTFHLIGKDFLDEYSSTIKQQIEDHKLEEHVFIYGSRSDTATIFSQVDIAILTSSWEGLPVAVLEYGIYLKPIVATAVGEIPLIIKNGVDGYMTAPDDVDSFYKLLVDLIEDPKKRLRFANSLSQTVMRNNSRKAVITQYLNWLGKL